MQENPFEDPSVTNTTSGLMGPPKGLPNGGTGMPPASPPSWIDSGAAADVPLHDGSGGGGYIGPYAPTQQPYRPPIAPPSGSGLPASSPETQAKSDNLVIYMRLLNVGIAVLLSAMAFIKLANLPGFDGAIVSLYIWFFAILLCCFETHLKQISRVIAQNFGFLYHVKGRCLFLVLIAMLCFGLSSFGYIAGFVVLGAAIFNTYVICKHPEYEEKTQVEDLEQRGPATMTDVYATAVPQYSGATRPSAASSSSQPAWANDAAAWTASNPDVAARGLSAGAQFAVDNPDLARSAATAATGTNPNAAYI